MAIAPLLLQVVKKDHRAETLSATPVNYVDPRWDGNLAEHCIESNLEFALMHLAIGHKIAHYGLVLGDRAAASVIRVSLTVKIFPRIRAIVLLRDELPCESYYFTETDIRLFLDGRFESFYHVPIFQLLFPRTDSFCCERDWRQHTPWSYWHSSTHRDVRRCCTHRHPCWRCIHRVPSAPCPCCPWS